MTKLERLFLVGTAVAGIAALGIAAHNERDNSYSVGSSAELGPHQVSLNVSLHPGLRYLELRAAYTSGCRPAYDWGNKPIFLTNYAVGLVGLSRGGFYANNAIETQVGCPFKP